MNAESVRPLRSVTLGVSFPKSISSNKSLSIYPFDQDRISDWKSSRSNSGAYRSWLSLCFYVLFNPSDCPAISSKLFYLSEVNYVCGQCKWICAKTWWYLQLAVTSFLIVSRMKEIWKLRAPTFCHTYLWKGDLEEKRGVNSSDFSSTFLFISH